MMAFVYLFTGCAFVTYTVRQSALTAISHMHHNQTMEVCIHFYTALLDYENIILHSIVKIVGKKW